MSLATLGLLLSLGGILLSTLASQIKDKAMQDHIDEEIDKRVNERLRR